jgi:hypothetical protein
MRAPTRSGVSATRAPAALAAFAAALQALRLEAVVRGDAAGAAFGTEVYAGIAVQRMIATRFVRNPACRFAHERRRSTHVARLTVHEALSLGGSPHDAKLTITGGWATALVCSGCGRSVSRLKAVRAVARSKARCRRCRAHLIVSGGDVREEIEASNFASAQLHRPLARLGVRRGDAFGVSRSEQTAHYFYDWTPAPTSSCTPAGSAASPRS